MRPPKFAVGDRVRKIDSGGGGLSSHNLLRGHVGYVTRVESGVYGRGDLVTVDDKDPVFAFRLELVWPKPQPALPAIRSKVWVEAEVVGLDVEADESEYVGEVKVRINPPDEEPVWMWLMFNQIKVVEP